uniref:MULE transposase domain-containing protein n=1 Tax=Biomphalaria glabrata TaxID=6526 RepID=A0A2C9LX42_BIOGL
MDCNNKMAPNGFLQLYVICVFLRQYSGFDSEVLSSKSDFEKAVMNSFQIVFAHHIHIQGCFYHFTQNTWRKIQELGLVTKYKESEKFRQFCVRRNPRTQRNILSLCFRRVPPIFPLKVWSVHSASLNSSPRTNNIWEG